MKINNSQYNDYNRNKQPVKDALLFIVLLILITIVWLVTFN